ncbi:MAG: DUF5335 family protein [Thiohalomonadaceae bacterium]
MATMDLDRSSWHAYFDDMARKTRGNQVYLETTGMRVGSQRETDWLSLNGITYDPKSDVLEVVTDKLDHLISHPSAISIDYDAEGLHNVSVIDAEGNRQLIHLKEPAPLPAH